MRRARAVARGPGLGRDPGRRAGPGAAALRRRPGAGPGRRWSRRWRTRRARPSPRPTPRCREAVDFARYYADARRSTWPPSAGRGVRPGRGRRGHAAVELPVRDPAGGVLAALAAGNAVVLKPAPQATVLRRGRGGGRCALARAGRAARRPAVRPRARRRRRAGASSPTPTSAPWCSPGRRDRASCSAAGGPTSPLLAETSGKNAIVVTAARRPRPRRRRPRPVGVRPRRAEVLGRVAADPRRLGGTLGPVPPAAGRRRRPRCGSGRPTDPATTWAR